MGTDTVPVSSHCDLCDAAAGGDTQTRGHWAEVALCLSVTTPFTQDLLEVGFRTMPASSLVVQGSPGAAMGDKEDVLGGSLRSAVPESGLAEVMPVLIISYLCDWVAGGLRMAPLP